MPEEREIKLISDWSPDPVDWSWHASLIRLRTQFEELPNRLNKEDPKAFDPLKLGSLENFSLGPDGRAHLKDVVIRVRIG